MENQIKTIMNGILDTAKNRTDEEYSNEIYELLEKIDLKDPEKIHYFYTYKHDQIIERAIELKMTEEGYSNNSMFIPIYCNFENLSWYLSSIVKKEIGYSCSTDKANFVLRRVMEKELKGKTVFNKGSQKTYTDPFYRNFNLWSKVIKTCPLVNHSKALEHAEAVHLLIQNIRKYQLVKKMFIEKFSCWLHDSSLKSEICEISKGKIYTYEEMFKMDQTNAFEWLKAKSPHILKIYKNQIK